MPKVYKARKIIQFLLKNGFTKTSQKGSHIKFKNNKGNIVIVPFHNKDIPFGTFTGIIEQSGLNLKESVKKLGK